MGFTVLNRRLSKLARTADAPFIDARVAVDSGQNLVLTARVAGTDRSREGGAGIWGPVPMPANPQVNEAEAKKLVAWILAQK